MLQRAIAGHERAHDLELGDNARGNLGKPLASARIDGKVDVVADLHAKPDEQRVDEGVHHLDTASAQTLGRELAQAAH